MEQQPNLLDEFSNSSNVYATTGQRFVNYLIDLIVFYAIMFVMGMLLGIAGLGHSMGIIYLVVFAVLIIYYTLLEGSKGQTIGKMVTKTKAVTLEGATLSYKNAFLRTLCRFVPFEFVSAFSGGQMWHDRWTDTMVIQVKN
ncbi:MAG TPA: RDD family protein [Puia sp.]|nr:RDD family protein [Puia sp.]